MKLNNLQPTGWTLARTPRRWRRAWLLRPTPLLHGAEKTPMLKIWGRISSINVRKVVYAAQELVLPFERVDAGLGHGIVKTQQTSINPAGRNAFIQWFRTPAPDRNMDVIAQSTAATERLMALLDDHLSRQPFMAGERLTMADIPMACELHRRQCLPQPRPERKHLQRWYDAMRKRPAARGVLDPTLS